MTEDESGDTGEEAIAAAEANGTSTTTSDCKCVSNDSGYSSEDSEGAEENEHSDKSKEAKPSH